MPRRIRTTQQAREAREIVIGGLKLDQAWARAEAERAEAEAARVQALDPDGSWRLAEVVATLAPLPVGDRVSYIAQDVLQSAVAAGWTPPGPR